MKNKPISMYLISSLTIVKKPQINDDERKVIIRALGDNLYFIEGIVEILVDVNLTFR